MGVGDDRQKQNGQAQGGNQVEIISTQSNIELEFSYTNARVRFNLPVQNQIENLSIVDHRSKTLERRCYRVETKVCPGTKLTADKVKWHFPFEIVRTCGEEDDGFETRIFGRIDVKGFEFLHLFLEDADVIHKGDDTVSRHGTGVQSGGGQ